MVNMNAITDTGVRGFLMWLKSPAGQPGIYKKVAAQIAAQLPQAFSGYHEGGWKTAGMSKAQINSMMNRLAGFGDDTLPAFDPNTLAPVDVTASLIGPATVDVSQAANTGPASSSLANAIGSIIAGASSLYMTKQQLDIQNQVVQTQLQRAAAGLPPLPSSLANLGVPQVAVGLTGATGGILLLGGGAILLFMLMSGKRKGR